MTPRGGLDGTLDRFILSGEHSSKEKRQYNEEEQHTECDEDAEENEFRPRDDDSEAAGQGNQVQDNRSFPPFPDGLAQLPSRNMNR